MSEWLKLTVLEVGSSWVWTPVLPGEWFLFEISGDVEIEVAQGDGRWLIGDAIVLDNRSQSLCLPCPPVIEESDRRLAFRTGEGVRFQAGWTVTVFSSSQPPPTSESDPAIVNLLQSLQTGQQAISQRLEQPITAQVDPALDAKIQTLLAGQAELLDQFPVTVQSDPTIVSALQTLLTGQQAIGLRLEQPITAQVDPALDAKIQTLLAGQAELLDQFPVTVQSDPAITEGIQAILQRLTPVSVTALTPVSQSFTVSQSSIYGNLSFLTGTFANMTDANPGTGAATNAGSIEWIQATFESAIDCAGIQVGGGGLPNWGGVAAYLNGKQLQYSLNGTDWIVLSDIARVTDSGSTQFVISAFPRVTARFFRVVGNSWLSTTEFRFFN
ncbi:discoidin domain-containing protein [Phormidesmis sp. 146-12]